MLSRQPYQRLNQNQQRDRQSPGPVWGLSLVGEELREGWALWAMLSK